MGRTNLSKAHYNLSKWYFNTASFTNIDEINDHNGIKTYRFGHFVLADHDVATTYVPL